MYSTKKLLLISLMVFSLGAGIGGALVRDFHNKTWALYANLNMVEDLDNGSKMIMLLQDGKTEAVLETMSASLVKACKFWSSPDTNKHIDQERVQVFIMRANENTGLC